MAIAELVTAEQYLHMSFEHDAEFVEGRIVERPLPTWEHSCIQRYLVRILEEPLLPAGWMAVPEQRVQTSAGRYRVPDVCVVTQPPAGPFGRRIVTTPPYLCVEILSPEDTASETMQKVREYLKFGVAWVWVIDPVTRTGQTHSQSRISAVENGIFSTDRFEIDLGEARM
jgi:Uma2 family endonuclease